MANNNGCVTKLKIKELGFLRGRNRFNNYYYNSPFASMYGTPNTAMFMNVAGVQVPVNDFSHYFRLEGDKPISIVFEAEGFLHNLVYTPSSVTSGKRL